MSPSRRNFLKITTVGGIASSILGFDLNQAHAQLLKSRKEKI